jgi:hypothetical protein
MEQEMRLGSKRAKASDILVYGIIDEEEFVIRKGSYDVFHFQRETVMIVLSKGESACSFLLFFIRSAAVRHQI